MSWIELSLDATHEAVDWVNTLLATTDYEGDVCVTSYKPPIQNPSTDSSTPPWKFTLCLYLPNDASFRSRAEKIAYRLAPLHRTGQTSELEMATLEEKPAVAESDRPLTHRIGQRFVVVPPKLPTPDDSHDIFLKIGSSLAFGSGLHPATVLSLRLLERHVAAGMKTLDLGCGSGILSVAIAKLGAQVLALDNDPVAVKATQDAVQQNGVASQVTVMQGSLGQGSTLGHWMDGDLSIATPPVQTPEPFDLIAANILARVHLALAEDYRRSLHPKAGRGVLVVAGFTQDYEPEIEATLNRAGFQAFDYERLDEWVAIAYQTT